MKHKLKFKVVSMEAKSNYTFEEVDVITKRSFESLIDMKKISSDDVIICHAPNLRNHLKLVNLIYKSVKKIIFIFHGHEVLRINEYYPPNYKFKRTNIFKKLLIETYDFLKLKVMRNFLHKLNKFNKIEVVFVSKWMLENAEKSLKMNFKNFKTHIINNNANFHVISKNYSKEKSLADFITVRPLDDSKYAIDQVVSFAYKNPNYTFHIYGKGDYFIHNSKPSNMNIINEFIHPKDFPNLLNQYKYALMPTRLDAQGVMMCEMAVYGIPTITSDLEVCKEMLGNFKNVYLASQSFFENKVNEEILQEISNQKSDKRKFDIDNTVQREIKILLEIKEA
ncbi:glycosyltransferase [Caryophanon tenue]|uniref:glycosyltransferase n=1 Tax=Caryophanon tenue TaxID=33978 RepID=UPI0014716053|nr:glycosyltransferase [Caryophanon tenue]